MIILYLAVQPNDQRIGIGGLMMRVTENFLRTGGNPMGRHPIEIQIEKADKAIVSEDFDTLLDIYTADAVLVVEPGRNARGKESIRKAFEAIAAYFKNGLQVKQNGMKILESGNTALVLANTVVSAPSLPPTERKATYVFNKAPDGNWLCSIDNSYGHEIVNIPGP